MLVTAADGCTEAVYHDPKNMRRGRKLLIAASLSVATSWQTTQAFVSAKLARVTAPSHQSSATTITPRTTHAFSEQRKAVKVNTNNRTAGRGAIAMKSAVADEEAEVVVIGSGIAG